MILVRNVFRLKFGSAKQAKGLLKDGIAILRREGFPTSRAYADLTGPFYTFVIENTHGSLGELETTMQKAMSSPTWQSWYQSWTPLVESGYREIFTVLD